MATSAVIRMGGPQKQEVFEYADRASFPLTGIAEAIYIAIDTNSTYRWDSGLVDYVQIGGGGGSLAWNIVGDVGQPAYQNSWSFESILENGAGFGKTGNDVFLKGNVEGGSIGTVVFTLPVGYRPGDHRKKYVTESSGGYAVVEISTTGEVSVVAGNNSGVCLDSIEFNIV